jgi:hypothetical protein
MSLRRQCYEWRNVVQNIGDSVFLNGYPTSWTGNCITANVPANQEIDIFIGGVGNNIDMPARLKAYQYVVIDAVAVFPPHLHAQIYVNTTRYFQDPDGVPSRIGGISGLAVPFPNGALNPQSGQNIWNYDYKDGLEPSVIIKPGQEWGILIKTPNGVTGTSAAAELDIAKCFVKYLLVDGADAIVAQRLANAGWPLTPENIWQYKQDIVRTHLYAGLAPLSKTVTDADRKV